MPDDAVMMDYMLEPLLDCGRPERVRNRLDPLYDEVDGFGYVLTTTHDRMTTARSRHRSGY